MSDKDCVQQLLTLAGPRTALTLVEGSTQTLCWSFDELQRQRRYAEQVLQAQGLRSGDRVLLTTTNNPHFIAIMLAAMSLELCLMPLHPDFSQQQLLTLLQEQPPRLVIVNQGCMPAVCCQATVLQVLEQSSAWLQPHLVSPLSVNASADERALPESDPPLLLFHSSGSTGQPKGMRYTRRMLNNYFDKLSELYGAFPDRNLLEPASDRVNVLPLTHLGGLSFCMMSLLERRSLHLLRSRDAHDHLTLLRQRRCQLVLLVPALLQEFLAMETQPLLPDLRHCLAMGESVTRMQLQLLSECLGLRVHNAYGMSECLTGIYNRALDPPVPVGSCGRLHFGEARLLSSDGAEQQDQGELCVRNSTTTPCYTDAALNRSKYREGWFHTGDLFRRDAAGNYFFVSRADLMCVINGRNVYPHEVEQVLRQHPAVAVCIAAPVTLIDGRQRLAAAVELVAEASITANELIDFYLQRGALYATPVHVQFLARVPRNGGDKPDRPACMRILQQGCDQNESQRSAGAAA